MKNILFIVTLFISVIASAQKGYINLNENRRTALFGTEGFNAPGVGTPALKTGQWIRAGAMVYDSTGGNKGIHVWNGTTWVRMVDTTMNFGKAANNGVVDSSGYFQLGQLVGAVGNPAAFKGGFGVDREIPMGDSYLHFNNKTGTYASNPSSIVIKPINDPEIILIGKHGGSLATYITDPAVTTFPGHNWYTGVYGSGTYQAFQGIHWDVATGDKHFDLVDLRATGSLTAVQIQANGVGMAYFGINGQNFIGYQVGVKRTTFGGSAVPGQTVSVFGSFSNTDSVITSGLLRVTDTTGFDVDMIDRTTGNHKKMYAGLIGSGGAGSQTPWTGNINADGFTLFGNDGSGESMTISSTSHATKGNIDFTTAKIDQANNWIIANAANTNKLYLGEASGYPLIGFGSSPPGISTYAFLGDVAGGGTLLNGQTYLTLKNNNNDVAKITATGMGIFTSPSVPLHIIKTTEQMRVGYDASNYLSTTITSDGTSTFDVTGSVERVIFNDHVFVNGPATFNDNGGAFVFRVESDNNADMLHVDGVNDRVGIGTAPAVQFHTTGAVRLANFGAGTATFDASGNISSVSDGRLKTIQGSYEAGLKEVMQLHPIIYKWKPESGMELFHKYAGLDAREVYSVLGDLGTGKDKDGYYSIQDRALIAMLINAVKELKAEIDQLKKRK